MEIVYDDRVWQIMDKVNKALSEKGLKFEDTDEELDGIVKYELKEI